MPRFNEAIAKQATTHHDAGMQRARAVAQFLIGDKSWAMQIMSAYAGDVGCLDGISEEVLREAVIEMYGEDHGGRLLVEAGLEVAAG